MFGKFKKDKKISPNKQKWLWLIAIFVFGFIAGSLSYAALDHKNLLFNPVNLIKEEIIETKGAVEECADCVRRAIDGVYVKPGKENLPPVAIIIENHSEARPQYGLDKANLVYEAETEGGITRFLAFFASGEEIEKIGPVRSARPYFVDWAREYSALFAHCGGSPEALAKIAKENIFDLNEYYNEKIFWRDKSTAAPHNIFTSSELLSNYLKLKDADEGKYLSWQHKDDEVLENRPSYAEASGGKLENNKISIGFKRAGYMVEWKYNKASNEYIRYNGGQIHKDAENNEIKAKNVIIEYVKAKVIDEEGRLKMEHIGAEKAIVCLDGKCEEGEWRKASAVARTRFYKKLPLDKGGVGRFFGEEFKLNAGPTWIEVVRPEIKIKY